MTDQVYRARKPQASPLWQCLSRHFDAFLAAYEARFQPRYGYLRPIIPEVVDKFLDCGDQLVRYYGWYSNKMRGQRDKQAAAAVQPDGKAFASLPDPPHRPTGSSSLASMTPLPTTTPIRT